jgi:DNA primase
VSSYVSLVPAGKNLKACCPFHSEKTPSFYVSPDRSSYYCFGCGAKGDVFTFVQEFEGLDFKGALSVLAKRAGVTLTPYKGDKSKQDNERLFLLMEDATQFFEKNRTSAKEVDEYLKGRGLFEQIAKDFRVGVSKDEWRSLYDYLTQKGYSKKEQLDVGLIKEANGSVYDRFRNRIMFPIFDTSGRVIAFSGRAIVSDEKTAKYLNSPDTILFQKSDVLYGLHAAKNAIRSNGYSVLVEGQFDLILSHQAGFANTVAASGTALTDKTEKEGSLNHFGIIKRLAPTIVLAFDSDSAGLKAMYRAAKICLSLDMEVKTLSLPEGKDPADIITSEGKDEWSKILSNSLHVILFLTKYIVSKAKDMRTRGKHIKEKVLPLVGLLESAMERDSFVDEIATLSGIPKEGIRIDLNKIMSGLKISLEQKEVTKQAGQRDIHKDGQIKTMIGGMSVLLKDSIDSSFDEESKKIIEEVIHSISEEERQASAFQIEATYQDEPKKIIEDLKLYIQEWKKVGAKKKLEELEKQIKDGAGDDILKQYQEILKKLQGNN